MIKIFIALIFIAELILATILILKMVAYNKFIVELNMTITENKEDFIRNFREIRAEINNILREIPKVLEKIKNKQAEYVLNIAKNILPYVLLLFIKGKYKKAFLLGKASSDIYAAYKESWC